MRNILLSTDGSKASKLAFYVYTIYINIVRSGILWIQKHIQ